VKDARIIITTETAVEKTRGSQCIASVCADGLAALIVDIGSPQLDRILGIEAIKTTLNLLCQSANRPPAFNA